MLPMRSYLLRRDRIHLADSSGVAKPNQSGSPGLSFQGEYQSCVNKLALLGARLHSLEFLARLFVGTQAVEQPLFLGRRHEVWMPVRWGGYDGRCAQDCE